MLKLMPGTARPRFSETERSFSLPGAHPSTLCTNAVWPARAGLTPFSCVHPRARPGARAAVATLAPMAEPSEPGIDEERAAKLRGSAALPPVVLRPRAELERDDPARRLPDLRRRPGERPARAASCSRRCTAPTSTRSRSASAQAAALPRDGQVRAVLRAPGRQARSRSAAASRCAAACRTWRPTRRRWRLLRDGDMLLVFPEGTRNRDGKARPQLGAARLALEAGAAFVPVSIAGSDRIKLLPPRFPKIRVHYGEPIPLGRSARGRSAARVAHGDEALVRGDRSGPRAPRDATRGSLRRRAGRSGAGGARAARPGATRARGRPDRRRRSRT